MRRNATFGIYFFSRLPMISFKYKWEMLDNQPSQTKPVLWFLVVLSHCAKKSANSDGYDFFC